MPGIDPGIRGAERLLALAEPALREALEDAALPVGDDDEVSLLLVGGQESAVRIRNTRRRAARSLIGTED